MPTTPLVLWDAVAILTLFDAVNAVSSVSGNLFVQKVGFLSELAGIRHNIRVAHFRFFRFTMGPYSAQLAEDVKRLTESEVVSPSCVLTSRGRYVLDYARDAISESGNAQLAVRLLREVAEEHGRKTGQQLKEEVYRLRVPVYDFGNQVMLVKDIPLCADIIDPIHDHNLAEVDPFDADTAEELMAELRMSPDILDPRNPQFQRTIAEAISRADQACL